MEPTSFQNTLKTVRIALGTEFEPCSPEEILAAVPLIERGAQKHRLFDALLAHSDTTLLHAYEFLTKADLCTETARTSFRRYCEYKEFRELIDCAERTHGWIRATICEAITDLLKGQSTQSLFDLISTEPSMQDKFAPSEIFPEVVMAHARTMSAEGFNHYDLLPLCVPIRRALHKGYVENPSADPHILLDIISRHGDDIRKNAELAYVHRENDGNLLIKLMEDSHYTEVVCSIIIKLALTHTEEILKLLLPKRWQEQVWCCAQAHVLARISTTSLLSLIDDTTEQGKYYFAMTLAQRSDVPQKNRFSLLKTMRSSVIFYTGINNWHNTLTISELSELFVLTGNETAAQLLRERIRKTSLATLTRIKIGSPDFLHERLVEIMQKWSSRRLHSYLADTQNEICADAAIVTLAGRPSEDLAFLVAISKQAGPRGKVAIKKVIASTKETAGKLVALLPPFYQSTLRSSLVMAILKKSDCTAKMLITCLASTNDHELKKLIMDKLSEPKMQKQLQRL